VILKIGGGGLISLDRFTGGWCTDWRFSSSFCTEYFDIPKEIVDQLEFVFVKE
jgi:hypothetical protein